MSFSLFINSIVEAVHQLLTPYSTMPDSTLLILIVASALSVMTTTAKRLLVDVKKMKKVMVEVNAWKAEFEKAKKSNNEKLIAKATKKQKSVMKLQSRAMWDRMKVSLIFLAPFWITFMLLSRFYETTPVALSPFSFPILLSGSPDSVYGSQQLLFFSWYLICSFAINLPLSRLAGVNPED